MTFEELKRYGVVGKTIIVTDLNCEYVFAGINPIDPGLAMMASGVGCIYNFNNDGLEVCHIKHPEKLYLWAVKPTSCASWFTVSLLCTEAEVKNEYPAAEYRKLMELPSE